MAAQIGVFAAAVGSKPSKITSRFASKPNSVRALLKTQSRLKKSLVKLHRLFGKRCNNHQHFNKSRNQADFTLFYQVNCKERLDMELHPVLRRLFQ
ncbi:hypothetical protein Y1Q_0014556 [Alligator mississippiensis]|uniref:Uncharacterized protein n=1 Tax=Alligator mississippiensis TaxID=8496 RepID=A0A151PD63_ALLMI|nr:hypothetical protein Y1Q_0014556 [Alligator mississippiensis]